MAEVESVVTRAGNFTHTAAVLPGRRPVLPGAERACFHSRRPQPHWGQVLTLLLSLPVNAFF